MLSKSRRAYIRSLRIKKHRLTEAKIWVEGWRALSELAASEWKIELLLYDPDKTRLDWQQACRDQLKAKSSESMEMPASWQEGLGETRETPGCGALVEIPEGFLSRKNPIPPAGTGTPWWLVLDGVSDPGNLGTIMRCASWFGAGGLLLSDDSVEPTNAKVVRASMGAIFSLTLFSVDLSRELPLWADAGWRLLGLDPHAEDQIGTVDPATPSLLVVGGEAHGIRSEVARSLSRTVSIPKFGPGESLNAAMAATVALAWWRMAPASPPFDGSPFA